MDKPRPGKTTFVIMVSPLPGKYELLPSHRPTRSSSPHSARTVTSLAPPPHTQPLRAPRPGLAHPGNNLRNLRVSTRRTPRPGRSGTSSLCAPLIYIRHAPCRDVPDVMFFQAGARDLLTPPETRRCLVRGASGDRSGPGVGTWEDTRPQCPAVEGWVGTRVWSHLPFNKKKISALFLQFPV